MPADNLPFVEPREFVGDVEHVLTFLQPTRVYLTPKAPESESEAENVWPLERNMIVWKDAAGAWHFKIQLLGEQQQGVFDLNIEDDERVVDCLNALAINSDAPEEISEILDEELLARIARPWLRISYALQHAIIASLTLSETWSLDNDKPVVLPDPPEGSEIRYGEVLREFDNYPIRSIPVCMLELLQELGNTRITPEMQAAIDSFEVALMALYRSVPNLSDEDRGHLAQSLAALRTAKTTWFNSYKDMDDLLVFRRATDAVLREEHIQRLYAHQRYPRLGMFSDYVASPETPELQQLRLSLRELRDFSKPRETAFKKMEEWRANLVMVSAVILALAYVSSTGGVNLMFLLAFPSLGLKVLSAHYGAHLSLFLSISLFRAARYGFSFDFWNAQFEIFREFFTDELPQALGAVVVISAGYGLIAGEIFAVTGMLTLAGMIFAGSFLLTSAILIGVLSVITVGYAGYEAVNYMADVISKYFENQAHDFNEEMREGEDYAPEGTGLAPT